MENNKQENTKDGTTPGIRTTTYHHYLEQTLGRLVHNHQETVKLKYQIDRSIVEQEDIIEQIQSLMANLRGRE